MIFPGCFGRQVGDHILPVFIYLGAQCASQWHPVWECIGKRCHASLKRSRKEIDRRIVWYPHKGTDEELFHIKLALVYKKVERFIRFYKYVIGWQLMHLYISFHRRA